MLSADLKTLLVSHAAVTWFLCGLIWTIQLVHYPSFGDVGREGFESFHHAHLQRIDRKDHSARPLALHGAAPLVTAHHQRSGLRVAQALRALPPGRRKRAA